MIFDTSEYVESLTPREEEVLNLLARGVLQVGGSRGTRV
jgi:DNA-binding NarL/FixJ family response regulator